MKIFGYKIKDFKGTVLIKITGLGSERFINICHHHNIYMKDIVPDNDGYMACLKAKDFLKLKSIIKTTGVHIKILDKSGFPFVSHKYRKRNAFIIGAFLFIGMLVFMSGFIWRIEINGNLYYSDEMIIDFLHNNDIGIGSNSIIINETALEEKIRQEFNEVIWVSVTSDGTKLSIDVKENITNAMMSEKDIVNDIIATKDGVINSITVRTGTPIVKPGDVVKAGDVLVTSKVECTNESGQVIKTIYTNADADIYIKTEYEYSYLIERNYKEKLYTGRVYENEFTRIGNRIFEKPSDKDELKKFENYDIITDYKYITNKNNIIGAVCYGYIYYREYELIDKSYSDEQLYAVLEENFKNYINKLQENSIQIEGDSVKIELFGYSGRAYGIINAIESPVGYQEPIITDEPEGTE